MLRIRTLCTHASPAMCIVQCLTSTYIAREKKMSAGAPWCSDGWSKEYHGKRKKLKWHYLFSYGLRSFLIFMYIKYVKYWILFFLSFRSCFFCFSSPFFLLLVFGWLYLFWQNIFAWIFIDCVLCVVCPLIVYIQQTRTAWRSFVYVCTGKLLWLRLHYV